MIDEFEQALAEMIHKSQCCVIEPWVVAAQWKDELLRLAKEEPVSEDLEKAIDTYLATYFGCEKEKQDWPFLKKMAIHFANWQKRQTVNKACKLLDENIEKYISADGECNVDWNFINDFKKCLEE